MHLDSLQRIVGLKPLPTSIIELIRLVIYADANHVLGQMANCVEGIPVDGLAEIFENAGLRAKSDHTMLRFEMDRVERALAGTGIAPIVLKGGAYVARAMRASEGRRVSDLDVLVQPDELDRVEEALLAAGWEHDAATDNPYDQRYYREHMHELPPLRHRKRGTVLDVHHQLLPKTSRYSIDIRALERDAKLIDGRAMRTFGDVDMFVHSSVHVFADGALDVPVRGLVELYLLFQELPPEARSSLCRRSADVGAAVPVGLALWALAVLFDLDEAATMSRSLVKPYRQSLVKWAALTKTRNSYFAPFAKGFLYVRSHYLRMPLYLLLPHLLKKAAAWRPAKQEPVKLPFP